ncbi:MAG: GGDEF domain-containing phosphodiesterase [Nevskia sp.]|nr:GGDEF domain-containing phosphodiesterase [Nevskia sp.]
MSASAYDKLLLRLKQWQFGPCAALYHVDLHDIRSLNRSAGPVAADRVITAVGKAIAAWAGESGVTGRLWSNEFIVAKAIDHAQSAVDEAMSLRELLLSLKLPGALAGWTLAVSIGVACSKPGADWAQVLQQAGLTCEEAKRRGTNQIVTRAPSRERGTSLVKIDYVEDFRRLLSSGALTLHPQPIFDIGGGGTRLAKAEFLLRTEVNGAFAPLPMGTIDSLEHFGSITELDRFSSRFILDWLDDNGAAMQRLENVSINLSARSIADGSFMYKLFNDVRYARVPRGKLRFEITETTAIEHLDVASEVIAELRSLGCGFSLDDFGSGLCSFGYLQSLPVDEVKIDGRFVREVATDHTSREIVTAIHQVAQATGKKTVAEFVDDRRNLEILREIGVDYAQGYLFYKVVTPEKLLELLGLEQIPQ